MLVAAGIAGLWLFIDKGGGHPPNVQLVSDGPTFFQALSQVNNSALLEPGGPWALFSVYGIATQIPFSPNLIGYAHTNQTVNSCGQEFNGLTLWNGTMPLFNGTFNLRDGSILAVRLLFERQSRDPRSNQCARRGTRLLPNSVPKLLHALV